mgnify:CR=1 FL=1
MTTVTLVQIAGRKLAMSFVSAFRTNESVGPAEFDQGPPGIVSRFRTFQENRSNSLLSETALCFSA